METLPRDSPLVGFLSGVEFKGGVGGGGDGGGASTVQGGRLVLTVTATP
jgi:hypothetical protein